MKGQRCLYLLGLIVSAAGLASGNSAIADEGGVSFWLPGQYGSFAAIAPERGFSLPTVTYHYSGSAGANQVLQHGDELQLGVDGSFIGQFIVPTYAPVGTLWGAQPSFSLAFLPAYTTASADAQLGPYSASTSDSVTGLSDLYPSVQLFWNKGVHNWMAYVTGDIPTGSYDSNRLTNIGLGHAAIDVGGAYTYLDPATGWECSATLGVTYNFENDATDYTSGIDAHLDWAVARFANEKLFYGLVGYFYQQLTADEGQPAILGNFESSAVGIGPQIGYTFDAGGLSVFTNLRVYWEPDSDNRLNGTSIFLTVNVPFSHSPASQ